MTSSLPSLGALAAGAALLGACASVPPPDPQLAAAHAAVVNAADAQDVAPEPLRLAQAKLGLAEQAMQRRDYRKAGALAEQATADAEFAAALADSTRAQAAAAQASESLLALRRDLAMKERSAR